jgi:RecA/RadA recombinase
MKYTVQRPTIEWVETVIDNADNLEQALELADEIFRFGEYEYVSDTWLMDYYRYFVKDENGNIFTEEDKNEM